MHGELLACTDRVGQERSGHECGHPWLSSAYNRFFPICARLQISILCYYFVVGTCVLRKMSLPVIELEVRDFQTE